MPRVESSPLTVVTPVLVSRSWKNVIFVLVVDDSWSIDSPWHLDLSRRERGLYLSLSDSLNGFLCVDLPGRLSRDLLDRVGSSY